MQKLIAILILGGLMLAVAPTAQAQQTTSAAQRRALRQAYRANLAMYRAGLYGSTYGNGYGNRYGSGYGYGRNYMPRAGYGYGGGPIFNAQQFGYGF